MTATELKIFPSLSACGLSKRWYGFDLEAVTICFLLACSLHAESCLHPAHSHTVLTVFIYCSKEGMRSRFIPVNRHVSSLQVTFEFLSLDSLGPDDVESLNECVTNQNLNDVFFSSSHEFWLCSMFWSWYTLRASKQNCPFTQNTVRLFFFLLYL